MGHGREGGVTGISFIFHISLLLLMVDECYHESVACLHSHLVVVEMVTMHWAM